MAKKAVVKKRNPQDATRRNVRAANARMAALKTRLDVLEQHLAAVIRALADQGVVVHLD